MEKHSHSVSRVALPGHMELDRANWVARSDGRGMVRLGAVAARHRCAGHRFASGRAACRAGSARHHILVGGLRLLDGRLCPLRGGLASDRSRAGSGDAGGHEGLPVALGGSRARGEARQRWSRQQWEADNNGNIVRLDRAAPRDARLERSWNRLESLGATLGTLMDLPAHWRREREIRKAVAALMEFDDRTLRDLGISGRSDIERVVRYCRDC